MWEVYLNSAYPMKRPVVLIVLSVLLLWQSSLIAQNPARPLIDEMLLAMSRVHSASARVKRTERIDGNLIDAEMRFKAMFTPTFKAYVYNLKPDPGTEVLFVKGWNNDNAYVNPNKFPWVNLNLDPEGSLMTENQHHSIFSIGFRYTEEIVRHVYAKHKDDFDKHVIYVGEQKWGTKMTDVVKIVYQDYGFENYTVKANESLFDIDRRLKIPAAKILEINPDIDDYSDVKAGQVIKIPNVYGKESIFMIDKETHLPVVQIIYDDKGLFEKYEYHDLKVNPKFSTTEFTSDFPDYNF